ncbi:hypothetical protein GCM10023238_14370 [Streptomyces heliomycini]
MDAIPRDRSFGNARLARQLLETMMTSQARRLGGLASPSLADLTTLLPEDLPVRRGPGSAALPVRTDARRPVPAGVRCAVASLRG